MQQPEISIHPLIGRLLYTWHQRHVFKGFGIDFPCEMLGIFLPEIYFGKDTLKKDLKTSI